MTETPDQPQDEPGEDEASWQEPEPAPEPPDDQQTHNPGGDAEPDNEPEAG